jgi:peptide/nickel transport system substrate-binding protein/oligopeptide transport system substrate-binding protein
MLAYALRRLAAAAFILLGVSLVTFALLYLLPADPRAPDRRAQRDGGDGREHPRATRPRPAVLRPILALSRRLLQGDLGRSYLQRSEVGELVWSRLPASLSSWPPPSPAELVLGLTMGVIAALRRGGATDQTLMVASFVCVSAPQFVVGILLLYVFAVRLGWFPIGGYGHAEHVVLPALTLGLLGAGWYSRMMRSSMLDVMNQDFIRTARAKGLTRWRVLFRHALPNAILPVIAYDRHRHRLVHVRDRRGGERLRLAWCRPTRLAGHPAGGHPDHHGCDSRLRRLHRARQPARGPRHAADRPAHQASLINRGKTMRPIFRSLAAGASLLAMAATAQAQSLDDAKQGGSMIVTYKDDVSTLDPAIGYDWQNWSMIKSLFDGLMDYEPGTTELRPDLAESYEISDDGLTYTFRLRPGVTFHNGREMTAEDVKYTLERVVNPETQSPGVGFFGMIEGFDAASSGEATELSGVRVVDPQTIEIKLSRPDATFLHVMALNFAMSSARGGRAPRRDFGRQPVGTGAFRRPNGPGQRARLREATPTTGARRALSRPDHLRVGQEPTWRSRLPSGEVDVPGDGIPPAQFQRSWPTRPGRARVWAVSSTPLHHYERDPAALDNASAPGRQHGESTRTSIVQIINGRAVPANQPLPLDAGLHPRKRGLPLRS